MSDQEKKGLDWLKDQGDKFSSWQGAQGRGINPPPKPPETSSPYKRELSPWEYRHAYEQDDSTSGDGFVGWIVSLGLISTVVFMVFAYLGEKITDLAVAQGINYDTAREIGNIPIYITVIVILAMALYAVWKHRRLILTGAAILLFIGGGIYAYASTRPDAPATAPAQRGQAAPASSFVSDTTATVTTDELNLRPEPGVGHGTVDLLYEGEQVELLGEVRQVGSATWVKVRAGGAIGWVNAGYLE